MVEADTERQALARQRSHLCLEAPHRPHRVGQHQHLEAPRLRQRDHRREITVHEGFAAGKADLAHRQAITGNLVEILGQVSERQIGQRIVGRRAFDIAAPASEIAQRASVEPQSRQASERDTRPRLPLGGDARVTKLGRVERAGADGEGRDGGDDRRSRMWRYADVTCPRVSAKQGRATAGGIGA